MITDFEYRWVSSSMICINIYIFILMIIIMLIIIIYNDDWYDHGLYMMTIITI